MSETNGIAVRMLEPTAGRDSALLDRLTILINSVYATAERGLWRDGTTRTTAAELAELVGAGQIAVAGTPDGQLVGSIRVHEIADDASEFGMLVAAPTHRGTGVGRALMDYVERRSRERGSRAMQLELLVPRAWPHPSKEFLKALYRRRGYRITRIGRLDDAYPHLAPLLATPCDLQIYRKPLEVGCRSSL